MLHNVTETFAKQGLVGTYVNIVHIPRECNRSDCLVVLNWMICDITVQLGYNTYNRSKLTPEDRNLFTQPAMTYDGSTHFTNYLPIEVTKTLFSSRVSFNYGSKLVMIM